MPTEIISFHNEFPESSEFAAMILIPRFIMQPVCNKLQEKFVLSEIEQQYFDSAFNFSLGLHYRSEIRPLFNKLLSTCCEMLNNLKYVPNDEDMNKYGIILSEFYWFHAGEDISLRSLYTELHTDTNKERCQYFSIGRLKNYLKLGLAK